MVPKVETFEHNIAEEIKHREASLTEISAASNDVGNNQTELDSIKRNKIIIIGSLTVLIVTIFGFGALGYIYLQDTTASKETPQTQTTPSQTKSSGSLASLSKTLDEAIGSYTKNVDKKDRGYVITLTSYTHVFAYVTRNEDSFIEELASLFPPQKQALQQPKETPKQPANVTAGTSTTKATTTTATSSIKIIKKQPSSTSTSVSTITTATQTPQQEQPVIDLPLAATSSYSDLTIANQNMRVWNKGDKQVVYAFVGITALLISDTPEGILALKGAILK